MLVLVANDLLYIDHGTCIRCSLASFCLISFRSKIVICLIASYLQIGKYTMI